MLARRIPQELCDTIIDTLHEDHDSLGDLKSCSLVCRSFVTRAQSHIFSTISVGRAPHEGHFDRILQASWLARLARFNALIGSSPRLLGYVRTLDIESCETGEIIILLAQIPWSRVHTVWIRDIPDRTPGLVLDSVHVLVAIPSLRKLTLESLLWKSWTADVLHAILAHCTVELQSLELWFHTLEPGSSLFPPLASPSTSSRSKIRELTLWRSPSIAELLNDPACSFDLSALRQIRCVGINAGLNALLRRSGATVRTLHINAADRTLADLDLTSVPAVENITADVSVEGNALYKLLRRWPTPERILTIRLLTSTRYISEESLPTDNGFNGFKRSCFHLDRLIVELPSVRKVEVEVSMTKDVPGYQCPLRRLDVVPTIQAALHHSQRKNLLFVSIAPDDTYY